MVLMLKLDIVGFVKHVIALGVWCGKVIKCILFYNQREIERNFLIVY